MNPINWVFGGSAVGKKHFIRAATTNPVRFGFPQSLAAAAYADGVTDAGAIVAQYELGPIIVRWQWNRETCLEEIIRIRPDITHAIYLCKVNLSVQVARVVQREGSMKWDELNLRRESEDVDYLAQRLSMKYRIPVYFVDASKEYPT